MGCRMKKEPRALHGFFGDLKTGLSIRMSYKIHQVVDYVKRCFMRLCLHMIEPGEHTRFSLRRSLLLDRLIVSLEEGRYGR